MGRGEEGCCSGAGRHDGKMRHGAVWAWRYPMVSGRGRLPMFAARVSIFLSTVMGRGLGLSQCHGLAVSGVASTCLGWTCVGVCSMGDGVSQHQHAAPKRLTDRGYGSVSCLSMSAHDWGRADDVSRERGGCVQDGCRRDAWHEGGRGVLGRGVCHGYSPGRCQRGLVGGGAWQGQCAASQPHLALPSSGQSLVLHVAS